MKYKGITQHNVNVGKNLSLDLVVNDMRFNDSLGKSKLNTTPEEERNKFELMNMGIQFYENGYRFDSMGEEVVEKLSVYFKRGYEIARRREYANGIDKKVKKTR